MVHGIVRAIAARCELRVLSWEAVLDDIEAADASAGEQLQGFYHKCLSYNPLRVRRATS